MSADYPTWQTQADETWKLSFPVDRATADRIAAGLPEIEALDPAPVLVVSEPDPVQPDAWQLDAYFEGAPEAEALALVQTLSSTGSATPERLPDSDWVTLSQGFLAPIRAGRFFVHTAAHADAVPADAVAFRIEASRAFGTGHHETTAGCLEALDTLANEGARFDRIADVGTGTGLLAFAARALWPDAAVIASDIDPVSIEVVRENMGVNGIAEGSVALAVADGMDAPALAAAAPFDLILANILAGPLIALAPEFARAAQPGAIAVLAGLLESQAHDVLYAYREQGFAPRAHLQRGDWAILVLVQGS
ncbi:50S ribosomal protein L11 methyltransferase [Sphingomonas nostoxanthinifaciens]|uniref:50S ribosomal protein L11 methyltransferase n=1 Tax=Sphingomonas nostoxanthinifaciens TaxID=2872652 RepID=UPI001CC20FF7|nr:50S ribosomal protein L11 methyltransferase [Sphingomonas nostoxanthinifaciens]